MLSVVLPLLLPDQFTISLTQFCIAAMRTNADQDYELVVVETGTKHFESCLNHPDPLQRIDKYLHRPERSTYVLDWNAGAELASNEILVHMGNDVIVGDRWCHALLEPFFRYNDCGVTCTAAAEPGAFIGPRQIADGYIVEGMFAPMMAFGKQWRLDPAYEGGYSDSDLIMRIYDSGKRSYRSCSSRCFHMDRITWERAYSDRGEAQIARGQRTFYERWGKSPLMMFAMIRAGAVVYGREHEFLNASVPPRPGYGP
jgi:hypothetical protein